jgi:hypothetical protein
VSAGAWRAFKLVAWVALSVIVVGAIHLHRTSSRALVQAQAARARGEFLSAVLFAEQAADCAPLPGAAEGRALLRQYAGEAEANKDRAGAAMAWQAYERALAATSRLTPDAAVEIRAGLSRASVPEGQGADTAHVPRLPEVAARRDVPWFSVAALAVMVALGLYVRRPSRLRLACAAGLALVFAGLGFLV